MLHLSAQYCYGSWKQELSSVLECAKRNKRDSFSSHRIKRLFQHMTPDSSSPQFLTKTMSTPAVAWQAALVRVFGLLNLKTRYFLTRDDRLRLRYVACGAAGVALVAGLYVGGMINPAAQNIADTIASADVVAQIEPAAGISQAGPIFSYVMDSEAAARHLFSSPLLKNHRDETGQIRRDPVVKESAELADSASTDNESPAAEERRLQMGAGDTLASLLGTAGLESSEVKDIVKKISRRFDVRTLKAGQVINVTLEPADTPTGYELSSLTFSPDHLRTIEVARDDDDNLVADVNEKPITKAREARRMVIDGSVYGSADKAKLPNRITANAIKLFSYAVDFQRDIHTGDKLEVLYDSYKTADGYVARTGEIVFARLKVGGKEYALYRYEGAGGKVDYYTEEGKSIRKSAGLMRTPVAFGRMSSGFGMRVHPVLGYTKMHKGVDFAAPIGTPVYASGDGVIERAGRFSSFGNYIRVRHSSKISTAYGHLSRFGNGIHAGVRVKQGQIIGYVGMTGRSTGPHLHYEVLVNNVQVSPASVKFSGDNALQGKDLNTFKQRVRSLGQEYTKNISGSVKLASAE